MIKKLQISQLKKNATKETLIQFQVIWQKIGQDINMQNIGKHGVKVQHLPN
jgi:hypothetical protein